MTLRDLTTQQTLVGAALLGAAAWTVFGTIEYALWALWPRFARVDCGTLPLVWTAGVAVMVLYPLAGALAGATTAYLARTMWPAADGGLVLPRTATLGLLVGVAGGTLLQFEPRGVGAALLVLTFGLALSVGLGVILAALGGGDGTSHQHLGGQRHAARGGTARRAGRARRTEGVRLSISAVVRHRDRAAGPPRAAPPARRGCH